MNKALKKTLIIIGIVIGAFVGLFLLLYLVLALIGCAMYGEARGVRKYVCDIPELNSGFAPQGVTYAASTDKYILTGYADDNTTLMYIVSGKEYKRVHLVDTDGGVLKGHAGGVTVTGNRVYVTARQALLLFDLDELLNATADKPAAVSLKIPVDNNAAYVYSDEKFLYVGEFYRAGNYETETAHYFTTPEGEENKAIISCYTLDETGLIVGADEGQPYPEYCISVTGLVQGFATKDGVFVLSRSYGLANSTLEYHTAPKDSETTIAVKFKLNETAEAKDVPLLYLGSVNRFKTLSLPAFGEDITIVNDRVILTNEASANRYFIGKLFGANKVFSYPLYKPE